MMMMNVTRRTAATVLALLVSQTTVDGDDPFLGLQATLKQQHALHHPGTAAAHAGGPGRQAPAAAGPSGPSLSCSLGVLGGDLDDDGLDLRVLLQAVLAQLAAHARLLVPAEGRLALQDVVAIDPNNA